MRDVIGTTRQSFIDRWVESWFKTNKNEPSFKQVYEGLNAIVDGWHKVIGSTPPPYFFSSGLASDVYQAAIRSHAIKCPWFIHAWKGDPLSNSVGIL